jgi:AraC-like DNA-binding protein
MSRLIRSACLTDYAEIARSVGLDPDRMLDAAGLPQAALATRDMKIPAENVRFLFETSANAADIDDLGLRLAERRALSNLGPVGLIVREQPTIRTAIETLIAYFHIHTDALLLRLQERDGLTIISPVPSLGRPVAVRQSIELAMGVLCRILRTLIGDAWKPQLVAFSHGPPRKGDAHRRLFRASLQFGAEFNGIVCAARDLDAPIPAADPVMAHYIKEYVDSLAPRADATPAHRVRDLVRAILPSGHCSIEHVATLLGTDRRTIHRRLARDGSTFSAIVDDVRTEMVAQFLEDRARPLYMVAEILGFSGLSAFSRWFHRRFGCSVSDWRRRELGP